MQMKKEIQQNQKKDAKSTQINMKYVQAPAEKLIDFDASMRD